MLQKDRGDVNRIIMVSTKTVFSSGVLLYDCSSHFDIRRNLNHWQIDQPEPMPHPTTEKANLAHHGISQKLTPVKALLSMEWILPFGTTRSKYLDFSQVLRTNHLTKMQPRSSWHCTKEANRISSQWTTILWNQLKSIFTPWWLASLFKNSCMTQNRLKGCFVHSMAKGWSQSLCLFRKRSCASSIEGKQHSFVFTNRIAGKIVCIDFNPSVFHAWYWSTRRLRPQTWDEWFIGWLPSMLKDGWNGNFSHNNHIAFQKHTPFPTIPPHPFSSAQPLSFFRTPCNTFLEALWTLSLSL